MQSVRTQDPVVGTRHARPTGATWDHLGDHPGDHLSLEGHLAPGGTDWILHSAFNPDDYAGIGLSPNHSHENPESRIHLVRTLAPAGSISEPVPKGFFHARPSR